jgi:DNA-binding transcriptional MocR family regulator
MQLQIDRHDRRPLYVQVIEQIKDLIRSGALPVGSRLPPIRELAAQTGLTRLTIHNAYAELQADGWINSFVGRGSFVAQRKGAPAIAAALRPPPPLHTGDMAEIMRLAQQPGILSFAQAAAAPSTFPLREFERMLHEVLADAGSALFDYGMTQGDPVLRDQLARYLLDRAVQVPPDHLLVTAGAQQGIDLALRALLEPGDTVLVEQPTYLGMVERMQVQGVRLVGVPLDDEGIDADALQHAIALHQPKLLYTIATFHNPTGISMSSQRQAAVLDIAQQHRLLILEDDVYGPLSYDGAAPLPLKTRDQSGLVLYLTSFSKILMPGLRIGLLAAAPSLLDPLIAAKRLTDLHGPQVLQHALARYLAQGRFAAHLRTVVALYRERRDCMAASLRRWFPAEARWTVPQGGLCFWVTLPPGLRSNDVYIAAIERGVAFAPGHVFCPEQQPQQHLRLSFAAHEPETIERGVSILGEVLHQQLVRQRNTQRRSLCEVPMV